MTTKPEKPTTSKIDYFVHAIVIDGRGEKIGSSLGVAFNNKNGNGWTAYLDASPIPVNGQIKLVGLVPNPKS